MRAVIIANIVASYREDADCPDFADCLAEHLPRLSDAYLSNPLALTRHLLAQGYGEPLPASGFGRDAETIMRAIVAGPCRHYAEFTRRQLAFDLRRDFEIEETTMPKAATVTREDFWRRYATEAEALYASGKLPTPLRLSGRAPVEPAALASQLATDMRQRIEANPASVDVNGPAMKAALRACGVRGKSRRDVLAFVSGLA